MSWREVLLTAAPHAASARIAPTRAPSDLATQERPHTCSCSPPCYGSGPLRRKGMRSASMMGTPPTVRPAIRGTHLADNTNNRGGRCHFVRDLGSIVRTALLCSLLTPI